MELDTMNIELIQQALRSGIPSDIENLLNNESTVFWVDWREEDDAIVRYCEQILQTGQLDAEMIDIEDDPGFELYIVFGEKRSCVPLVIGTEDRHITLHSLNQVLSPDYEIRFFTASYGSDTLAFVPLSASDWQSLEQEFGPALQQHFMRIEAKPNLFTDPIRVPKSNRHKWWQFWK